MTPVYSKDGIDVYHGDALAFLPTLTAGSVDAVVTDPPYNVGIDYEGTDDKRPDYRDWCACWFAELRRVCSGPIAIAVGTKNLAMWCGIAEPHWVLCWYKPGCMGNSPVGACNWEPVLLYGKSRSRKARDVIEASVQADKSLAWHPCPKPLRWGLGFVRALTKPGDLVLDPFGGSGTIPVACVKSGRRCMAIEKAAGYVPKIIARLTAARTPLFDSLEVAS